MKDFPLVSVIIPSYNHEKYVGMAINSVLNQSYQNFELIILDDASTDESVSTILKFQDRRIKFYPLLINSGAVPAINTLIEHAKGKYIALLNSDDFWEKDKLTKQVEFMEENNEFGMVFSSARLVTQDSTPDNIKEIPETLFDQKNLSQGKMLRKMFFELNFLCHPSILIRREMYKPDHPYNCALRQCPDFEMYIFLLKFAPAFIIKDKLVNLRIMDDSSNTSSVSYTNMCRSETEIMLIFTSFFDNMTPEVFEDGFEELCIVKGKKTQLEMECEQAFMYLKVESPFARTYQLIGIQKLFKLLSDNQSNRLLEERYNFTYRNFFELTGKKGLTFAADHLLHNFNVKSETGAIQQGDNVYDIYQSIKLRELIMHKIKLKIKTISWLYKPTKRILNLIKR